MTKEAGHGFKQRPGIDFSETYTPLICLSTVRMVLSEAAAEDLTLPKGLRADKATQRIILDPGTVARVKTSLYGLRQSGLNWYETVREYFIGSMHLRPSQWESGLYFFGGEGSAGSGGAGSGGDTSLKGLGETVGGAPLGVVLVWVDDMLVIGSKEQVPAIIKQIAARFQIKDLGDADSFLGIKIERDRPRADGMTKPLDRNLHLWMVAKHLGMGRIEDQVDERMEDDARV
jgi:hypothetical protein